MKRLPVTAVVLTVLLCTAAPAHAKGVVGAKVCGANGCNDVRDPKQLQFFNDGSGPTVTPHTGSGWYRVTLAIGAAPGEPSEASFTIAVLPDEGLVRAEDRSWMAIDGRTTAAYRAVARGLEPLPVSQLGLKPVNTPASNPASGDGDGVPWLLVVLGAAIAVAAIALSPPVRRRFAPPEPSS